MRVVRADAVNGVLSVSVVGVGIGEAHIREAYARHPDKFRLSSICDTNADRLARVGEEFGVEKRYASFDEMLANDDVQVVDICTPPFTHYDMIVRALDVGKNVICEKPFVGSLRDIDDVIERERASTGRVMPIFQFRNGTGIAQASALIRSGVCGVPLVATVETMWNRTPEYYRVPWRGRWKTELGGVLTSQAIHSHDLLTHLLGPIRTVYARTDTRLFQMEIEDTATVTAVLDSGVPVSMTATVGSADEITRLRLVFEHVTMESDHSPYNPGGAPWKVLVRHAEVQDRVDEILRAVGHHEDRFSGQMLKYHEALLRGDVFPVTLDDARASIELVTALHFSSRTHSEVTLPLGRQHPYYRGWSN